MENTVSILQFDILNFFFIFCDPTQNFPEDICVFFYRGHIYSCFSEGADVTDLMQESYKQQIQQTLCLLHRFEYILRWGSRGFHREGNHVQGRVNLVAPVLDPQVQDSQAELDIPGGCRNNHGKFSNLIKRDQNSHPKQNLTEKSKLFKLIKFNIFKFFK